MPNFNFSEILIIGLVLLLFGKDYIPAFLGKFLGVKVNGKNGNGYVEIIASHEKRLEIANSEMGSVKQKLEGLEISVAKIEVKLDVLIEQGKYGN